MFCVGRDTSQVAPLPRREHTLTLFTSDFQHSGEQLPQGLGLVSEREARSHLKGPAFHSS